MPILFFMRTAAMAVALLPALAVAESFTLDEALRQAVQRSEAARSARAGVLGATEAARAAGQLPDPVLRAGIDNLAISGGDRFSTRDVMTMKRIGVGQEWLSAEKRAARQAAADAMVGREAASLQSTAADVRLQTGLAYLDAYFAGQALQWTALNERHAREDLAAARARQSSAAGSAHEVLAWAAALGIAEDESAELRQQQAAAHAALERWVGARVDVLAAPAALDDVTEAGYVERHPTVVAAQRGVALARDEAGLARVNRNPNWTWELSYGQRAGYPDMVSVGVSIPLAIAPAQRQDRDVASKLALAEKAEAGRTEAERMARGEYRALASDAVRLAGRVDSYRAAVLAPAQQRTQLVMAAYRSNQTALTALFEARHAEVQAQRKLLALQRDLARAQAQMALKPVIQGDAP
jgi:cobalt-zinc-cadmium efflux system outer membrane protein